MEWRQARELAAQLLTLGTSHRDPGHLLIAHRAMGDTLYYLGEFLSARTHLEQGIALYDINHHGSYAFLYGQDPLVGCQAYAAHALWLLGYPEQAVHLNKAALVSAQQCAHLFSLGFALRQSLVLYGYLREWQTALEQADILRTLVREHGLTQWLAGATMAQGLALAMLGDREGIARVRQGIRTNRSQGGRTRPGYLIQLAEVSRVIGQEEEGLHLLNEALSVAEETGERSREAESHRLKGAFLLQQSPDNATEAESCFHHAMAIAQSQQAKSWELRAATSLAKLWQQQGKCDEARQVLGDVYGWFTEGFDTLDLRDAKALLDELA
jgi:adenylate cyclase